MQSGRFIEVRHKDWKGVLRPGMMKVVGATRISTKVIREEAG
jgi:hypothetical protein